MRGAGKFYRAFLAARSQRKVARRARKFYRAFSQRARGKEKLSAKVSANLAQETPRCPQIWHKKTQAGARGKEKLPGALVARKRIHQARSKILPGFLAGARVFDLRGAANEQKSERQQVCARPRTNRGAALTDRNHVCDLPGGSQEGLAKLACSARARSKEFFSAGARSQRRKFSAGVRALPGFSLSALSAGARALPGFLLANAEPAVFDRPKS